MCLKPLMMLKFIVKRSQNKINNCLTKDIFYLVSNRSYLLKGTNWTVLEVIFSNVLFQIAPAESTLELGTLRLKNTE